MLNITLFPAMNRLPTLVTASQLMQQQQQQQGGPQAAAAAVVGPGALGSSSVVSLHERPGVHEESHKIVDAHSLQGISMEEAIAGIARAMPVAIPHEELMLRRFVFLVHFCSHAYHLLILHLVQGHRGHLCAVHGSQDEAV